MNFSMVPHRLNLRRILNILRDYSPTPKTIKVEQGKVSLDDEEIVFADYGNGVRVHPDFTPHETTTVITAEAVASHVLRGSFVPRRPVRRGSWCARLNTAIRDGQSSTYNLSYAYANWNAHEIRCGYCQQTVRRLRDEGRAVRVTSTNLIVSRRTI